MTTRGSLALILHAHLPFVRHPEHEVFLEEDWLFEAITESYVPLLRMMQRLVVDGVDFRLTMSITPTLCAMLNDPLLRSRYRRHLDWQIELAEAECARTLGQEQTLADFYLQFFRDTKYTVNKTWNDDLLAVVCELRDQGVLEIIASAATHAILPILSPAAARAQIAIGCDEVRQNFGVKPIGFWLPECAYSPALDEILRDEEIRWFVLDPHATPQQRDIFAPIFIPAGPAVFSRDLSASRQVWEARSGYPGDPRYRDFYRDIGFDRSPDQIGPLARDGRKFTGLKYYRVTGQTEAKEFYDPLAARETARIHAQHFVEHCAAAFPKLEDFHSILTVAFDAELFGHWWFEGPIFLEHVIRFAAQANLSLTTPSEYLRQNPIQQIIQPHATSWGDKGYLDVWLDETCGWIYPHLHAATEQMIALAKKYPGAASSEDERILRQLARELLLAQASDWAFQIRNGTAPEYATRRLQDHLSRFQMLAHQFESGRADADFLAQCEARDNLFRNVDWRKFS